MGISNLFSSAIYGATRGVTSIFRRVLHLPSAIEIEQEMKALDKVNRDSGKSGIISTPQEARSRACLLAADSFQRITNIGMTPAEKAENLAYIFFWFSEFAFMVLFACLAIDLWFKGGGVGSPVPAIVLAVFSVIVFLAGFSLLIKRLRGDYCKIEITRGGIPTNAGFQNQHFVVTALYVICSILLIVAVAYLMMLFILILIGTIIDYIPADIKDNLADFVMTESYTPAILLGQAVGVFAALMLIELVFFVIWHRAGFNESVVTKREIRLCGQEKCITPFALSGISVQEILGIIQQAELLRFRLLRPGPTFSRTKDGVATVKRSSDGDPFTVEIHKFPLLENRARSDYIKIVHEDAIEDKDRFLEFTKNNFGFLLIIKK